MCVPDEGGTIRVHNSSQYLDGVQQAVASALGLRLHDVNVVCRRASSRTLFHCNFSVIHIISHFLGLRLHDVHVVCRRASPPSFSSL